MNKILASCIENPPLDKPTLVPCTIEEKLINTIKDHYCESGINITNIEVNWRINFGFGDNS